MTARKFEEEQRRPETKKPKSKWETAEEVLLAGVCALILMWGLLFWVGVR